jgi:uncharacterized membrane protein
MLQADLRAPPATVLSARLPAVDAARGLALLAMAAYHLAWDLRHFGYITADVTGDLGWRLFARAIAGSFLFLVGVSLVLAQRRGFRPGPFFRRLAMIAAGAAAITLVTRLVFPDSYVFFGILHHIAVASVLALPFVHAPVWLTASASALAFTLPELAGGGILDASPLVWLGLSAELPRSNDFVPLFPWFGVVLAGVAFARLAEGRALPARLAAVGRRVPPLLWAGRHSLAIYLLHQPLLYGVVYLASVAAPPDLTHLAPEYVEACTASCLDAGGGPSACAATCTCLSDEMQQAGLWEALIRQTLDAAGAERYFALADSCRAAAEPP